MSPETSNPYELPARGICLVGMPGAGKSTVARLLAPELGRTCLDTDTCVERHAGLTISQIFRDHGERTFRKLERDCILQALEMRDVVIACGGGAPCFDDTMDLLMERCHVIYLRASVQTLIDRLGNAISSRPMIPASALTPEHFLEKLLGEREDVYSRAHLILDVDTLSAEDVVSRIVSHRVP